jgi:hypothetical protein
LHHLNKRPRKTLEFETQRSGLTAVLRRPVELAAYYRTLLKTQFLFPINDGLHVSASGELGLVLPLDRAR